jgi:(E)-4-hydroxy-3-methylbut-2-enyl-diphosphate synthase
MIFMKNSYCKNFTRYIRRQTNEVFVGTIPMGGANPIRVQSMINTDTCATIDSVRQIIRIASEKADYVRLTVPGLKDAENLSNIIAELTKQNCNIPLIADIHFNPRLARIAAAIVDKVRINPGNFIDKTVVQNVDFTNNHYLAELDRLKVEFLQLLEICKKNNTAIRIGTNHGSLSDRIINRFGDTPLGMAESAMEFLRICKEEKFNNVVVSMKASNTRIMVYATRLLVSKMDGENMQFPLHLGVTEAGEGEDGRIKSAVGIGTILADGIGDTIRVSLTEDPELEIPVARKLVSYFEERENHSLIPSFGDYPLDPYEYNRRNSHAVLNIGGNQSPVVLLTMNDTINKKSLGEIGWYLSNNGEWSFNDISPDVLVVSTWPDDVPKPQQKHILINCSFSGAGAPEDNGFSLIDFNNYKKGEVNSTKTIFVQIKSSELLKNEIELIGGNRNAVIVLETDNENGLADQRGAIFRLMNSGCTNPVIIKRGYKESLKEDFQLKSAADTGGLFIDGLADGIWIENSDSLNNKDILSTAFGILQASRVRTSKTEYISCPSCGRTMFDLQTTTRKIRERTNHLKGLKIGVMGCIVNGPGEMADADYGYVGSGRGKVTLYKEKEVIKRNVPEENAVDELVVLIKENGDWVEP